MYTKVYKYQFKEAAMTVKFVIHNRADNVGGVAIDDIREGEEAAGGVYIENRESGPVVKALNDVPWATR